ncbi:MAG: twin-arginine translocase subunit TatC [Myxococcota bacterium]
MSLDSSNKDAAVDDIHKMPFIEHLRELRHRILKISIAIIIASFVTFTFRVEMFTWLASPLQALPTQQMQVLSLVEMFVTYLKLSVLAAVFVASPYVLGQVWLFIAPGLHSHEKRWIIPFVSLGSLFFIAGGAFAFYVVLPLGFDYLVAMVPRRHRC